MGGGREPVPRREGSVRGLAHPRAWHLPGSLSAASQSSLRLRVPSVSLWGLGLPSSGFLESQKSRGVPCTWAGVCVLQEPCFHGKQSLRIPKGQTVSPTAERGASGCLVLESVENKDNVDIWGCDVTESQPFKGKNHLSIYPACNIQCFAHLSNWITIFSSL